MTEQNIEHDEETRASEEVDGPVDIYEDVPDFDEAPWTIAPDGTQEVDDAELA